MGDQEEESVAALGEVLATALKGRNCLMVALTDLSHFHDQMEANRLDGAVREAIETYDPEELMDVLSCGDGEACGGGPVAAVMTARNVSAAANQVSRLRYVGRRHRRFRGGGRISLGGHDHGRRRRMSRREAAGGL
jgi:AmmeMemoRadiSam system protein B